MDWQLMLLIIFGGLFLIMLTGLPVAFCFLLLVLVGAYMLWGGGPGVQQLIVSQVNSVTSFTLLPLLMFILMGELLYQSGVAPKMMDAVAAWLGKIPGRLSLISVGAGTLLSVLTGVSVASTAILGSVLVPEMEARGYKKPMTLGPILGSGGLAIMIPPSPLAVLIGAIGRVSIGQTLVGIIVPGLMMAALYGLYIIIRCRIQPDLAPAYDVEEVPMSQKISGTIKYILPAGIVFFMAVGLIFLGVATPTEAGATGAVASLILAFVLGKLNWQAIKKAFTGTISVTVMVLFIITTSVTYGQILAFTGVSTGLSEFVASLAVSPVLIMIGMQLVLLFAGMFMSVTAIIMIFTPMFVPLAISLGFSPVWFAVTFLLNMELGTLTPPFGLGLFAMKGVAPKGTTMGDIYRAAMPFVYLDVLVLALLIAFPNIALWLPGLMTK